MSNKQYEHSLIASVTITKAPADGKPGAPGQVGLSIIREDWVEGREYRNDTDVIADVRYLYWVHLPEDPADVWYVAKPAHNGVLSSDGNRPAGAASQYWDKANIQAPIYTPALFAKAITADQIDVDDVRAEMIESKKIQADEIDVDNLSVKKLDGAVGSFKTLQCINSAGAVVGSISFNPNGSMWFSGDLYHQGVKDSRSLRFYAANINVRGSLGARQMNTVVVDGSQARYYPNGYGTNEVYTIINLTALQNTAGETYYIIPLYSPTGMEGISFNNVLLASTSTSTFRYVLSAAPGCNVTVVNTNDNGVDNTRIVYTNGKPYSIQGGSCADLICVHPDDMTPTLASNILGRGWLCRGYFDNDWR